MPLNESEYTRRMSEVLTQAGAMVESIVGSRMNKKGRPDRYVTSIWWHGWLEAKINGEELSPHQIAWHEQALLRQPKSVYVIRFRPADETAQLQQWSIAEQRLVTIVGMPLEFLTKPGAASKKWVQNFLASLA